MRHCAWYAVWIVGATGKRTLPFACVVVVATDCVPLPYGCDVSVTGSFVS